MIGSQYLNFWPRPKIFCKWLKSTKVQKKMNWDFGYHHFCKIGSTLQGYMAKARENSNFAKKFGAHFCTTSSFSHWVDYHEKINVMKHWYNFIISFKNVQTVYVFLIHYCIKMIRLCNSKGKSIATTTRKMSNAYSKKKKMHNLNSMSKVQQHTWHYYQHRISEIGMKSEYKYELFTITSKFT